MNEKEFDKFQIESFKLFKKYGLVGEEKSKEREQILFTMLLSPIMNNDNLSTQDKANAILDLAKRLQFLAGRVNTYGRIENNEQRQKSRN